MFSRRFLREKVIQSCYGFFQGGAESAVASHENLLAGLEQTSQLYFFRLRFLSELLRLARERHRAASERGYKPEALLGLQRMAQNALMAQIEQDADFLKKSEAYRVDARALNDLLLTVYEPLFALKNDHSPALKIAQKMEAEHRDNAYERDRHFLLSLHYRIAENAALRSFCEERSIFWESDYEDVSRWICALLLHATPEQCEVGEGLNKEDEAVRFGLELLDKTLLHAQEYDAYIAPRLKNWKYERVGLTEKTLLSVAVCELINFPSIPVKASLNEYIELSKWFCTQDSATFINGVLHRLVEDLTQDKKIKKSGRGLIA